MIGRRFPSLDGLRGLAALVVLICHSLIVGPRFAAAYGGTDAPEGWVRWFAYSPLHLMWGGGEAVYVFFVLSGFVLMLPFLRNGPVSWPAYYAKRLIRLYIPVWVSVIVSVGLVLAVNRSTKVELSWWLNDHIRTFDMTRVIMDASLVSPGAFNTALWSLSWEVLFSLLLPAYVLMATRLSRYAPHLAGGALGAVALGVSSGHAMLVYPPMFAIGALLAVRHEDLLKRAARIGERGWALVAAATWLLVTSLWWAPLPTPIATALAVAGAGGVVFLFLGWPLARRAGNSRAGRWLGERSFSLYLVHEPILVTLAFAFPRLGPFGVLVVGGTCALLVADRFFRLVESPALQFARQVGQRFSRPPMAGLPVPQSSLRGSHTSG